MFLYGWCIAHIYFLIGLRNRVVVALARLWSYIAFQRGARLITGGESDALPPEVQESAEARRHGPSRQA